MPLTAIALNCSLKSRADESSSTDRMIGVIAGALARHDVTLSETIRMVDHDVKTGVTSDEGEGDAWPDLRRRILEADILIFGTPVWLGQMSSYWVGEAMGKIDFKDLGEVLTRCGRQRTCLPPTRRIWRGC